MIVSCRLKRKYFLRAELDDGCNTVWVVTVDFRVKVRCFAVLSKAKGNWRFWRKAVGVLVYKNMKGERCVRSFLNAKQDGFI